MTFSVTNLAQIFRETVIKVDPRIVGLFIPNFLRIKFMADMSLYRDMSYLRKNLNHSTPPKHLIRDYQ